MVRMTGKKAFWWALAFTWAGPLLPVGEAADGPPLAPPGASLSEPAPAGATGPDVVVSAIGPVMREWGRVGDVAGYSMDTISCNRGDQEAIWIDCVTGVNCNQHPVIGQSLYRLRTVAGSTRFEQIGMSWLKHAFCAADSVMCGPGCQANFSCDWLGVNCSDLYSASLNGFQQGLGPHSEVNAYTGEFPYPYRRAWQQAGDAVFKRLQVHDDDLDPALNPGAQYFGESHYIMTDEQAPTRFNNASWREVQVGTFSASVGWRLDFMGTTMEQEAALEAWPQVDPGVILVEANVPNEGRFVLGYKATALGPVIWHYEYALYNMNSDRSAGSFSVPIPDGLAAFNIGFHDVDYHSGEPYSGADWSGVHAGQSVTWVTEAFAVNEDANALRWDTTYNFRFDSDAPPAAANITVALFKPGAPATLTITAVGPQEIPPGCECTSDLGCDDGNVCTAGACIDCLCSQRPNVYGDVDHNGVINIFDLLCVLKAFAGGSPECGLANADIEPCDGDDEINLFDLFAVLRAFAGTDPCCGG